LPNYQRNNYQNYDNHTCDSYLTITLEHFFLSIGVDLAFQQRFKRTGKEVVDNGSLIEPISKQYPMTSP